MTIWGRPIVLRPGVLVDFPARLGINKDRRPLPIDREIRILTVYQSASGALNCNCPRVVKTNGQLLVWHSPECEEAGA